MAESICPGRDSRMYMMSSERRSIASNLGRGKWTVSMKKLLITGRIQVSTGRSCSSFLVFLARVWLIFHVWCVVREVLIEGTRAERKKWLEANHSVRRRETCWAMSATLCVRLMVGLGLKCGWGDRKQVARIRKKMGQVGDRNSFAVVLGLMHLPEWSGSG